MFTRAVPLAALLIICQAAWCSADGVKLTFPEDRDCGSVLIAPQPIVHRGLPNFSGPRERVGKARGVVTVPEGAFVELDVNATGATDLSFLNSLPADSIQSLKIHAANLGIAEFTSIARFSTLRNLFLTYCRSPAKLDLSQVPAAAALQSLNYSMSDVDGGRIIAAWAAKCPKLQYLYDRDGTFNLSTLQTFKGHPSLYFLTVTFGDDATEMIQALSEIPHLRGLNVEVKTDDYLRSIPLLKSVELFNWNGGYIGAATLKAFGQLPNLRCLRFQGRAKIQADFSRGLQHLATVEELVLNPDENECPTDELQAGLCSMKRLTEWPKIQRATRQTLESMIARGNVKRVDINALGADAKLEQVVNLCQTKTLEQVTLQGIPFTAPLGDALSTCSNLKFLSLDVEDFDGNNLRHPEKFVGLERCSLSVDRNTTNLSPLARLPRLQELSLSAASLQPKEYRFIAESRSLISFSTQFNIVNDEMIEEIAKSTNVRSLHLGQNCLLSDAGLERLVQCRQLTNLFVCGNFSVEGIRKLDRIPGLTSLSVFSLLSITELRSLETHFANLDLARFGNIRSNYGDPRVGADGCWREYDPEWRQEVDALEGKSLRTLLGSALSESMEKDLQGKVVLVDFWGTWCGPCLGMMPELNRYHETYGKQQFAILGIHTQRRVETLDDYLQKNPKPWPNLRDTNGDLARAFAVPHYPGLYLFDRQGKLRVAVPFRPGLETAIQKLLRE